ncbi:MAG: Stf0 family sulfotransferase [Alphaproteobacteria bacterium]
MAQAQPSAAPETAPDIRALWQEELAGTEIRSSVILASTFRSGSTFAATLLNANGVPGLGREMLADSWRLCTPEVTAQDCRVAFRGILANGGPHVLATKLMWPHRTHFAVALGFDRWQAKSFADQFPEARWLQVMRRDKFAQAVSFWRAKTSGRWHVYRQNGPEPALDYDFSAILTALREIELHDQLWDDFFREAEIEPFRILYEDILDQPAPQMSDALAFLGIDRRLPVQTDTRLRQQSDALSDWFKDRFLADLHRGAESDASRLTGPDDVPPRAVTRPARPVISAVAEPRPPAGARPGRAPAPDGGPLVAFDFGEKLMGAMAGFRRESMMDLLKSMDQRLKRLEVTSTQVRQLVGPFGLPMSEGTTLVQTLQNMKYLVPSDDLIMTPQLVVYRQWEPKLSALLPGLCPPGTTFVDVGAGFGYYACLVGSRLGAAEGSRVIAVEPNPVLADLLTRNMEINWSMAPIHVERAAAGEAAGTRAFRVPASRPPAGAFDTGQGESDDTVFDVPVILLDRLLWQESTIGAVKIDVEGHELSVLKGAAQTLQRPGLRLVLTWNPGLQQAAGHDPAALLTLLGEAGFDLHDAAHYGKDPSGAARTPEAMLQTRRCELLAIKPDA